jgi:hypothetical protein
MNRARKEPLNELSRKIYMIDYNLGVPNMDSYDNNKMDTNFFPEE